MKKIIFLLIICFNVTQVSAFTDIENNWYKQSILELKELEMISGFDNGTFLPEDNTTRAEILKIILLASDTKVLEPEESCFSDIYISVIGRQNMPAHEQISVSQNDIMMELFDQTGPLRF